MVFAAACQAENRYNNGYQQTPPVRFSHIFHLNFRATNSILTDLKPATLFFIGSIVTVLNNSMLSKTFLYKKLCTYSIIGC
jgi:hypothetical protein